MNLLSSLNLRTYDVRWQFKLAEGEKKCGKMKSKLFFMHYCLCLLFVEKEAMFSLTYIID